MKYIFELTREEINNQCSSCINCASCPLYYAHGVCAKDLIDDSTNGLRDLLKFLIREVQDDRIRKTN